MWFLCLLFLLLGLVMFQVDESTYGYIFSALSALLIVAIVDEKITAHTAKREKKTAASARFTTKAESGKPSAPALPYPEIADEYVPSAPVLYYYPNCADILEQPHVLIGGTTGSGKSTFAHSIIYTLCADNPLCKRFYGIDLKRVELAAWKNDPHCNGIAVDPETALSVLETVSRLVDIRLSVMEQNGEQMFRGGDIYLIIDEMAELLSVDRKAVVDKLSRIMRLGRAAKVHVLAFTQAPNRGKGGGLDPQLCQNFTAAVALRCRSAIESRQIVGVAGAEMLPQYGEGIYWNNSGVHPIYIPKTSKEEIRERVSAWTAVHNNGRKLRK